ncbi:MAG TPA: carboxypeptidase M32 [Candidatus Eisenbacteria bacterium]|nr:carboxypeptidase M32 [Candidatus Eisenbacteria bacterium]
MDALQKLKQRLIEIDDLRRAGAVLSWDQTTYMPPAGGTARGRQMATLSRLAHQSFIDAETGRLLDAAAKETESAPYESDEASLIRVTRRRYDRDRRMPASLVSEIEENAALSYQAWTVAKPANDFDSVRPHLERSLELSRRAAGCYPGYDHIADPLIDTHDHGMKAADIRQLFHALRGRLEPLVQAIAARPQLDDSPLRKSVPLETQLRFGLEVIRAFGFDFTRGRQDLTHHPFMTKFAHGDVRITTRSRDNDLTDSLFSTLHECGHALYEMGIDPALEGTPLSGGASSGVHESQSRLWENLVGRSRGFWECFLPRMQATFGRDLATVSVDAFYRAINRVERSLIRTDSDEATYNLHVMLRFDLELDLLEGKLAVKDLARVWRERFQASMGVSVPDDTNGVLQDVHWYHGLIGGQFQGYTLGNILSAQFFATAVKARPEIPEDIRRGTFGGLHDWLRDNIYRHGSKFTPAELTKRVTGSELTIEPYMAYLEGKFRPLYGLS